MDKKTQSKIPLVTNSAFGVEITTKYLDARYTPPVASTEVEATETGELRLFRIDPQPNNSDLPFFSARWDHNGNTLDIDLVRNGRYEKNFRGHHTVVAERPWGFKSLLPH